MNRVLTAVFIGLALFNSEPLCAKDPILRVSLDRSSFCRSDPIKLLLVLELGDGCWSLDPNVTALTYSVHVFDDDSREVRPVGGEIMYDLPRCNLATFCRVNLLSSYVFLCDRGRDMYAPYFNLNPGRYLVKVVYDSSFLVFAMRTDEDEYCRAMAGRRDVVGRLESNVVAFEVRACDSTVNDSIRPTPGSDEEVSAHQLVGDESGRRGSEPYEEEHEGKQQVDGPNSN